MNKTTTVRATVDGVEWLAEVGGREVRFYRRAEDERGALVEEGEGSWSGSRLWCGQNTKVPMGVIWTLEHALRAEPATASTPATRLAALGRAMGGRPLPPLDLVAQIIGAAGAEEVRELLATQSTLEQG